MPKLCQVSQGRPTGKQKLFHQNAPGCTELLKKIRVFGIGGLRFSVDISKPSQSASALLDFQTNDNIWTTQPAATLAPEVSLEFSPRERAAKRRMRVAKRRERKTSGYLGLESHFHADAGVMIWPSGSDWLIFLQTRKSTWLVCLIGNTEGTVRISVIALLEVNFACLYQERELFA